MTSRTTRTISRTTRTIHIRSPPRGGLLIGWVLMVLEVVLVVLEVVLVVLGVTGPQVQWGKFQIRLSLRPDLYSPAPPIRRRASNGPGDLGEEEQFLTTLPYSTEGCHTT